ncbi:MAG: hypothetical protein MI739_01285 [Bacteroidales bacterium]|nr:hypothetical protein [Bacteroidales bacterium]
MNKRNKQHLSMFLTTQNYLDEHTSVWTPIPRVVSYKNDFDELLTRIFDSSNKSASTISITNRKQNLQKVLANKAVKLSGAMQAYCFDTDKIDLQKQISITQSKVVLAKDSEIEPMISLLIVHLNKNLTDLADFGVTEAMVTELQTTLNDFNALIGKPRIILNKKYTELSTLDQLFDEANALLRNKMDKIMIMFKDTENGFYEGYLRNRVIVDK